jgi:glycosyltransferase involved in cell wall biosynthesis
MRVLSLVQKPQRRGAEIFAADFGRWLKRQGHSSRLVALYRHTGGRLSLDADDVSLNGEEASAMERGVHPRLVHALVREIRRFSPDVVLAHGGRTLKYAGIVRWFTGVDALWVYRNIDSPRHWLRGPTANVIMPALVRAAFDAAIGVSQTTLEEVHRIYGFVDASEAIENGVDFDRLAPRNHDAHRDLAPGTQKILWVGALGPQKRPDVALSVLAMLSDDTSLTLVGEGPWRSRVIDAAARLEVSHRVRLLGSRDDVGDLMRAAHVLLVTSDTDGIPGVVVEAQHLGLPVVAFDVGGLKECVAAGVTGWLVPHGDVDTMAATITRLKNASGPELSRQCREYAERFNVETVGSRYVNFFRRQLRARRL